MKLASNLHSESNIHKQQTRLLDMAHKLDPKFADALANAIDDDPARASFKRRASRRLEFLGLKKKMAEDLEDLEVGQSDPAECAEAAWLNLSNLNAGRLDVKKDIEFVPSLRIATLQSINDAYPIYAYAVANSCHRVTTAGRNNTSSLVLFNGLTQAAEFLAKCSSYALGRRSWETSGDIQKETANTRVFNVGQREDALEFIRTSLLRFDSKSILVCDPYFKLQDLAILKMISECNASAQVTIIANRNHIASPTEPLSEETLLTYWRREIGEQEPPMTECIFLGLEGASFPIHDRWIVAENAGLRLGTSFGSIGVSKLSEISTMSDTETEQVITNLRPFLERTQREYQSHRIRYTVLSL